MFQITEFSSGEREQIWKNNAVTYKKLKTLHKRWYEHAYTVKTYSEKPSCSLKERQENQLHQR